MTHVAFIHGLEGSPQGTKVLALREQGFEVTAADMHMSLWSLEKRNSAVRNVMRLPEPRRAAALAAMAVGLAVWRRRPFPYLLAVAGVGIWAGVRRKSWMGAGLAKSFETCVEIQRAAIEASKPDVVVGSSWGGAVAAQLILDGAWKGPTILLAPAIARVRDWTKHGSPDDDRRLREASRHQSVLVFHAPNDETVPYEDSVALSKDSEIELRQVDDGGHRLIDLVATGILARAIEEFPPPRGGTDSTPPNKFG